MLMEPGETHRTLTIPSSGTFKVAMIPPEEVAKAAEELGLSANPHLRAALAQDDNLNMAVRQLGEIAESGDASLLEIQSRQAEIVHRLLGYAERVPSPTTYDAEIHSVHRAIAFLHAHLDRQVTLDELVVASGLGRYRLVRAFTRLVGVPPHAYHLQLRIAEARQLLQKGMPGCEIATDLGFTDQPHFIRHFRKILCVSPGVYAQAGSS
jgi:AraC-like DNA-binding protein